jgi:hypothetical protein
MPWHAPNASSALLKSLAVARAACVKALTKLPAGRTVMRSGVDCLISDIDELGALLTGNPSTSLG